MTKIMCDATKCAYNQGTTCHAKQILITEQGISHYEATCCGAYLNEQNYANLAQYTTQQYPLEKVECKVGNCIHYCDECCTLNKIHVGELGEGTLYIETYCKSFEQR